MRKHLILLMLLSCLHIATRGQTTVSIEDIDLSGLPQPTQAQALRYWFDDDAASIQTINTLTGNYTLDVSQLIEGLHTLHYQVIDTEGRATFIRSGLFLKVDNIVGTVTAQSLRYWFDDETVSTESILSGGIRTIDASALLDGLHTIHYQVVGNEGQVYSVASRLFMKTGSNIGTEAFSAIKLLYWFDDETTVQQADIAGGVQLLDASGLIEGLHTLHYQVLCNNGQMTPAMSSLFMRVSTDSETAVAQSLRYWFDDEQTATETPITEGVQLLDASWLIEGLHTIHYQIADSKGTLGSPYSSVFLKIDANTVATARSVRYWFDDDASTVTVTDVANGSQVLDVSSLLTGLHTLNYQLIDSNGNVGVPVTRIFMKSFDKILAEVTNRVMKYQYWLNTNSQDMQTVELASAANPYSLIALLPMQHEPIHSDCFQFEVTDGVPTVYAKNIFYIRFYDAQNYFSDGQKPFVDYSVSQEVTDAEWLEPGVRATTDKPVENAIKWYCLTAERGDSVQFCLDRAATVQLFAPSGEELLSVSGSKVVEWFGCHVRETGTYYLALHDVTATWGDNISIDYEHIDKYAILTYSPSEIGVTESIVTIHLDGNGYDMLQSASLICGNKEIIADSILVKSKSEAELLFYFSGNEILGTYAIHLEFEEEGIIEELQLNEAVNLVEAQWGEIVVEVSMTPTSFRPFPVTVKVTNTGNVTHSYIPLNMAYDNPEAINDVVFQNFFIPVGESALSEGYSPVIRSNNFLGDNVRANVINVFILELKPRESKEFIIGFTASSNVNFNFYAWVGKSLNEAVGSEYLATNIPSLIDYYYEMDIPLPASTRPNDSRMKASSFGQINSIAQNVGNNAETTGRLLGNIYNGVDHYGDMARLNQYGIDPSDPLYDQIRNLHPVQPPSSIFNNPFSASHWFSRLWENQQRNSSNNNPRPDPNNVNMQNAYDPNEISGYTAESGSKSVKDGLTDVYYRIEFENDPEFATAAAHDIYLTDTLDATKFNLSTFAPTRVRIGEKTVELTGDKNFVTTIDMRPEINAIAQVEGTLDKSTGIAKWHISSLDPMTMEPTNEIMDGVLPVNTNGRGIGEVMFDIKLKDGLAHGTEIKNRAGIVFDTNETIMTPYWTNIIDRITPESHVADVKMATDSTAAVSIAATDELSGPWRYNVYVQYGDGAWFLGAENVPIDKVANVKVYEGINHGFYTVVTDSAGNVEQKEAAREFTLEVFGSQVETNTQIALAEGWNWISQNQQEALSVEAVKPKAQRIVSQTEELYKDARFGWSGDLEDLLPTEMYKVQMAEADQVQLSGLLFNAAFRSVSLREGWNWMGYPVAMTMTPAEAMAKIEAEEGDVIIGQDGMAVFSEGQWTGTLTEMRPGQGYMYHSVSDKNLFLNATAQSSSRRNNVQSSIFNVQYPEGWTVDKRRYPNVMGVVAQLCQNGSAVDSDEWLVGAFCGDECRGMAQPVGDVLMMNVCGKGGEQITFRIVHRESGELVGVSEGETFHADMLGTMRQPYQLNMGELTGIKSIDNGKLTIDNDVYDLQGRKVDAEQTSKGVYIVTDGNKSQTQKVVRK